MTLGSLTQVEDVVGLGEGRMLDARSVKDESHDHVVPFKSHWRFSAEILAGLGFKVDGEKYFDDGGNEVQSKISIKITSLGELNRLATWAAENCYGLMPKGGLTSAKKHFQVYDKASLHQLKGFIVVDVKGEDLTLSDEYYKTSTDDVSRSVENRGRDRVLVEEIGGVKQEFLIVDDFTSFGSEEGTDFLDRELSTYNGNCSVLISLDPNVPDRTHYSGGLYPQSVDDVSSAATKWLMSLMVDMLKSEYQGEWCFIGEIKEKFKGHLLGDRIVHFAKYFIDSDLVEQSFLVPGTGDKFRFRLDFEAMEAWASFVTHGRDLTTKLQATAAGATLNGSMGPMRFSPAYNLKTVVGNGSRLKEDGSIESFNFVEDGEEAKDHVGQVGNTGAITELVSEHLHYPPRKFGFIVALSGERLEAVRRKLPKLMNLIGKDNRTELKDSPLGKILTPKFRKLLLAGHEILTRQDLLDGNPTDPAGKKTAEARKLKSAILSEHEDAEAFLMVNGYTDLMPGDTDDEDFDALFMELFEGDFADIFGEDAEFEDDFELTMLAASNVDSRGIMGGVQFSMEAFEAVRECIPASSREKGASQGFTMSTGLNFQIDSEYREEGHNALWKLYSWYIEVMEEAGFEVSIYGHNGEGFEDIDFTETGGVCPHIRVKYLFRDHETGALLVDEDGNPRIDLQELALQKYQFAKDMHAELYERLLDLDGVSGIRATADEKGIMVSSALMKRWQFSSKGIERLKRIKATQDRTGGPLYASRNSFPFHFAPSRMPKHLGGIFSKIMEDPDSPEGASLLDRHSKAIMLWAQKSHRGADRAVLYEVTALIRDYLGLNEEEFVLYEPDQETAVRHAILQLSEGEDKPVLVDSHEELVRCADEGKQVIYVANGAEQLSDKLRDKAAAVVYDAQDMPLGGESGVRGPLSFVSLNVKALQRAKSISKTKAFPFASWVAQVEKGLDPIMTPKMKQFGELGVLLGHEAGFQELPLEARQAFFKDESNRVSFAPGPGQMHKHLIENSAHYDSKAQEIIDGGADVVKAFYEEFEATLREFYGLPDGWRVLVGNSASEMMEEIVCGLKADHLVALNHGSGSFGHRFAKIAKANGVDVDAVQMLPFNGPNSKPEYIGAVNSYFKGEGVELFEVPGHETAHGVSVSNESLAAVNSNMIRIVDGTSEQAQVKRDWNALDLYFGSLQKHGFPAGCSVAFVSPEVQKRLKEVEVEEMSDDERLQRRLGERLIAAETGEKVEQVRAMYAYMQGVKEYITRGGLEAVIHSTREKFQKIMDFVDANEHFVQVIPESRKEDRSEFMLYVDSLDVDMNEVRRQLSQVGIEGVKFDVGAGYGGMKETSMRIYLGPNVNDQNVDDLIQALGVIAKRCVAYGSPEEVLKRNHLSPNAHNYPQIMREKQLRAAS